MPCADVDACDDHCSKIAMSVPGGVPDSDEERGHCTPLCLCSCCHISVMVSEKYELQMPVAIVAQVKPECTYVAAPTREVAIAFFQPPRMV
jgi:hypothetical protein